MQFESCAECQSMLQNGLKCSSSFLDLRNEKNPILPEIHINEIVHLTNCVIEDFMEKNNILKEKKLYQKIAHSVIRLIDIKRPDFMSFLNCHQQPLNSLGTHRNIFLHKIIRCFVTLRLHHLAKQKNESIHQKRLRPKLNKLILFNNQ